MDRNQKTERGLNRREFLGVTWTLSLVVLFGQAGAALFSFLKPRLEPGSFGGKVVAGNIEEFEPGTVSHILSGRCYITRLENGGMLALWQRCTHLGCTIPWQEVNDQFHCPCHSSIFTPVGEVVSGPAPRPMDLFPIEIVEDEVVVDTGNPIQRQRFEPSQLTFA